MAESASTEVPIIVPPGLSSDTFINPLSEIIPTSALDVSDGLGMNINRLIADVNSRLPPGDRHHRIGDFSSKKWFTSRPVPRKTAEIRAGQKIPDLITTDSTLMATILEKLGVKVIEVGLAKTIELAQENYKLRRQVDTLEMSMRALEMKDDDSVEEIPQTDKATQTTATVPATPKSAATTSKRNLESPPTLNAPVKKQDQKTTPPKAGSASGSTPAPSSSVKAPNAGSLSGSAAAPSSWAKVATPPRPLSSAPIAELIPCKNAFTFKVHTDSEAVVFSVTSIRPNLEPKHTTFMTSNPAIKNYMDAWFYETITKDNSCAKFLARMSTTIKAPSGKLIGHLLDGSWCIWIPETKGVGYVIIAVDYHTADLFYVSYDAVMASHLKLEAERCKTKSVIFYDIDETLGSDAKHVDVSDYPSERVIDLGIHGKFVLVDGLLDHLRATQKFAVNKLVTNSIWGRMQAIKQAINAAAGCEVIHGGYAMTARLPKMTRSKSMTSFFKFRPLDALVFDDAPQVWDLETSAQTLITVSTRPMPSKEELQRLLKRAKYCHDRHKTQKTSFAVSLSDYGRQLG